jgi:hypothetical protein
VINPSQRPLPTDENTTYKHKRKTFKPRGDSNPRFQQQPSGRRPTPQTRRPLGSASKYQTTEQIKKMWWAVLVAGMGENRELYKVFVGKLEWE